MLSINKHQCKKSCNCIIANRMQKWDTGHLVLMWWISPCQELQISYTSHFHGKLTNCGTICSKCLIIWNARIQKRTQMWIKELGTNSMRMEKKINWTTSTMHTRIHNCLVILRRWSFQIMQNDCVGKGNNY